MTGVSGTAIICGVKLPVVGTCGKCGFPLVAMEMKAGICPRCRPGELSADKAAIRDSLKQSRKRHTVRVKSKLV